MGRASPVSFNVISGRYRADAGRVLLHGRDITHAPPQQIHRLGLARSFQITSLFPRLSAFENVRCALLWTLGYRYAFWRRIGRLRDASERALAVLEKVGLAARAGGRGRTELCRAARPGAGRDHCGRRLRDPA
jgi:branched-chain amino acid transport system ATP-binding protein